jgi:nitrogen regulatory protein PII
MENKKLIIWNMKAVMIVFNQALTEKVEFMLDFLEIQGYTMLEEAQGRGTNTGEPRYGTHTWPEKNAVILCIVEDDMVKKILEKVKKIDEINKEVGIRAFVWSVEDGY